MSLLNLNLDPNVIGYWCRVHNLTLDDLRLEVDFEQLTNQWSYADHEAFEEGVEEADGEIAGECRKVAIANLRESLAEAFVKK